MVTLTIEGGKQLRLPLTQSDITYKDFLQFREYGKKMDALQDGATILDFQGFVADIAILLCGDLAKDLPFGDIEAIENGEANILTFEDEVTAVGVYLHFLAVLAQPLPAFTGSFYWGGNTYEIGAIGNALRDFAALKTGEVVEALQVRRDMGAIIEQAEKEATDFTIMLPYHLDMEALTFAIILRKKGEKLPINQAELRKFATQRAGVFQGLPMDIVLQVHAFFLNLLTAYSIAKNIGSFSRDANPILTDSQPSKKLKPRQRAKPKSS